MKNRHPHHRKLEKKRLTFFLIGLILALSSIIAVLEYKTFYEPQLTRKVSPLEETMQLPPITSFTEKKQPVIADKPTNLEPDPIPEPDPKPVSKPELKRKIIVAGFDTLGWDDGDEPVDEPAPIVDYIRVEKAPIFPGCDENAQYEASKVCFEQQLKKFILENTNYPEIAKRNNASGRVYVSFVITDEGEVRDVKIVRSVDRYLDAEAMRVVKSIPRVKPAEQRGIPVNLIFTVPINFSLE